MHQAFIGLNFQPLILGYPFFDQFTNNLNGKGIALQIGVSAEVAS
jgi:hypothetical protein